MEALNRKEQRKDNVTKKERVMVEALSQRVNELQHENDKLV